MLREGMFIADRYEILDRIGSGGMSDVYKAKCHKLNRYVAIKVLKQEFSEDKTFVTKFRAEAQAAAGLMHANIVNVYDVGEENGIYYIVMELVEGITLKKYIDKKGILGVREAVSIAIQIAQGIDAAHKHNVVHRDIKPQNIIISKEGKVKVTDFGIARAASANTINSTVMGSVHYISPEQARGGYSDEKSDIYSFGITLYEMLTGKVPFEGDTTVSVALQHIQDDIVSPKEYAPEIPVSVEKIVLKCTQKKTERRYQSMSDLIVDLKKSLVTPDEDFVEMAAPMLTSDAPTKMIGAEEMNEIVQKSSNKKVEIDVIDPNQPSEETKEAKEDDELQEEIEENFQEESIISESANADEEEDDLEEDEEEHVPNKIDRIITILVILVAVAIVAITVSIIVKTTKMMGGSGKNPTKPTTESTSATIDENQVIVPDLLGLTEKEATDKLKEMELGIRVEEGYSEDKDTGKVIRQSIDEGELINKHETIVVTISKGSKIVDMPKIVGLKQDEAEKLLVENGLKHDGYEYVETDDEELIGTVVSTDPEEGTQLKSGDKVKVVLYIGKNVKNVKIPDFTEKSLEDAIKEAKELGFKEENIELTYDYSDTIEKDYVMSVNGVKIGDMVPVETKFGLVVSLGKPIVPDIIGKTKKEAAELLDKYTLKVGKVTEEFSDTVEAGNIIKLSGSIKISDVVDVGTEIDFVISKGKEKTEAETTQKPTEAETTTPAELKLSIVIDTPTIINELSNLDENKSIVLKYKVTYTKKNGNRGIEELSTVDNFWNKAHLAQGNVTNEDGKLKVGAVISDAKAGPATLDILVSYYTTDSEEVQSKTISITDAEIK